ncbi:MAG: hypothetical protein AB7S26_25410 [Sandaracinaceae bacterium]
MKGDDEDRERADRYALTSMSWSGWGSPVGIAILIAAIGFFLVCLHEAGILG